MEENNITVNKAVQTIKGAILRAQAQASQSSNAIQLSLYYGTKVSQVNKYQLACL